MIKKITAVMFITLGLISIVQGKGISAGENKVLCEKHHNGKACQLYASYLIQKNKINDGRKYIIKAYKYGNEDVLPSIASYYEFGVHGFPKDKKKAKQLRDKYCSKHPNAVRDECPQHYR